MARLTVTMATISKLSQLGATITRPNPWGARSIAVAAPRPLQASVPHEASAACDKASQTVKQSAHEMGNKAEHMKNLAKSSIDEMTQKTKDAASKVPENAHELGEKAKKTAQEAWGAAKDAGHKIKDTVVGQAEQTAEAVKAEAVKDSAATVKRCMNTKNIK